MPGFGKVVSKTKAFGGASSGAGGSVKAKPTIKLVGKKAMMKTKTIGKKHNFKISWLFWENFSYFIKSLMQVQPILNSSCITISCSKFQIS